MTATMSIDLKKNRIRIHRTTLQNLNNPDIIYLLINPLTKELVVCPRNEMTKDSIIIRCKKGHACDFYSYNLVYRLAELGRFSRIATYRLEGTINPNLRLAVFNIESYVCIENENKEGDD